MYRAAVLTTPKHITIEHRPEPLLKPNEVWVKMEYAGVCGTDIALYSGDYPVPLPLVIGHEFSGIVEKVGSDEYQSWVGKPVVAEINNTCVAYKNETLCPACQRGLTNHCLTRTTLGIINYDGVFADYVKIPVGNLHSIPPGLSLTEAVLVEPLAAAFRTFELSTVQQGDLVVLLGLGRLGQFIAAVARQYKVKLAIVVHREESLETARKFGADYVFCSGTQDVEKEIKTITQGLGADMVIEATGNPAGFSLAMNIVRPQGTLALKTTCGLPAEGVDATKLVVNEIRIQGSRCGPFDKALAFMVRKTIDYKSIISDILPLEETGPAIELASSRSKVLIRGNS